MAGLVARPSGMTGVCTDVTSACVSSVFPSVTVCTSRPSGTTSDGSSGAGLSGTPDEMTGVEGVMETLTRLMRVQSDAMTVRQRP